MAGPPFLPRRRSHRRRLPTDRSGPGRGGPRRDVAVGGPSVRIAATVESDDGRFGTEDTGAAGRARRPRCARSTEPRSAPPAARSTGARVHRDDDADETPVRGRPIACSSGPCSGYDATSRIVTPEHTVYEIASSPELAQRLIETVLLGIDRERFPWLHEEREPTDEERRAAILASAAMLASRRVEIDRRNEGKTNQENRVEEALLGRQFIKVQTRTVNTSAEAPTGGRFCRESVLAGRKADVLVGLWDTRLMPIECKVSNSATNSIKRLNNDAAVKAVEPIS